MADALSLDVISSLAEIAVALAGFIGIVLVIQHRDAAFRALGVTTIFGASFGAMMFSLLPNLFVGLLDSETMWRVICGTFGVYHLYLILQHQLRQRSIRQNTPVQLLITLASFPVVGLKIAVGFGFCLAYAFEIYYLGLLWLLGVSAYLFAMVLFDAPADRSLEQDSV